MPGDPIEPPPQRHTYTCSTFFFLVDGMRSRYLYHLAWISTLIDGYIRYGQETRTQPCCRTGIEGFTGRVFWVDFYIISLKFLNRSFEIISISLRRIFDVNTKEKSRAYTRHMYQNLKHSNGVCYDWNNIWRGIMPIVEKSREDRHFEARNRWMENTPLLSKS